MRVVSAQEDTATFATALDVARDEQWHSAELFHLLHEYYAAMESDPYEDHSVAVLNADDHPIALAYACDAGGEINYFRMPVAPAWAPKLPSDLCDQAGLLMIKTLIDRLQASSASALQVAHAPFHGPGAGLLNSWQMHLAAAGASYIPGHRAVINLTQPTGEIWKDVRKSYRPLINAGRRTMQISVMDKNSLDPAVFSQFQAFHQRMAGRVTRSQASWDRKFELLRHGLAEMIITRHDDTMIGCTYVFFDDITSQYATGVYERALFEKPISHCPLYIAIERAKDRGNLWFNLGDVLLPLQADPKERNIAQFKKGFSSRIEISGYWRLEK